MKGRQLALMPGNDDRVGYWLTPPDLMKKLDDEFHFTFDACPYPRPAGFDGLLEDWGERTYVNPPFRGSAVEWGRKAIREVRKGNLVVLILPLYRADHISGPALDEGAELRIIPRVAWIGPNGKATTKPRTCALFILRPHP